MRPVPNRKSECLRIAWLYEICDADGRVCFPFDVLTSSIASTGFGRKDVAD